LTRKEVLQYLWQAARFRQVRLTNANYKFSGFQSRLIKKPVRHFGHKELKNVIDRNTSGGKK